MRNKLLRSSISLSLMVLMASAATTISFNDVRAAKSEKEVVDLVAADIPSFTGAYLSGQIADSDSDIENAIDFYNRALEFDPENREAKRRLFTTLIISGDFETASGLAETLKDDAEVAMLAERALAVRSIQKREYRRADKFLDLEETNPVDKLINQLLSAWAKLGDNKVKEAIAQVKGLEGPTWYSAFQDFNLGMMAAASGDYEAAKTYFGSLIANQDAIQIAPDTYLQGVMALATLHNQDGKKDEALAVLTDTIRAAFAPADALKKKIEQDIETPYSVANAQSGASFALYTIGAALNREGNEDIVALYLQFARALDVKNAAALVMLAELKEQLGQSDKAIAIYRTVPDNSPMKRLSELQLGLNLADVGQVEEALAHISELIKAYPNDIRAYLGYGNILSREKNYQAVVDNYENAIRAVGPIHDRTHWNLFYQLGIGYERLKVWDKAEKAFLRSLELSPNQPSVMNYLGYSWVDMNIKLEEGIDMIKAAVDLRPNDGYIVDSLGWAYYRQGKYEEATRELERAVELRPADPTINDHLGDAFWQVGRKIEAKFQWERALLSMADFDESQVPILKRKLKEGLTDKTAANDG
jgi:tetratricopeptide (TPR) repeat protein